jgi:hypothetical protein
VKIPFGITTADIADAFKAVFGFAESQVNEQAKGNAKLYTYDDLPAPGDGEVNPETGFVSIKRVPKHPIPWWKKAIILLVVVALCGTSIYLGFTNFKAVETVYELNEGGQWGLKYFAGESTKVSLDLSYVQEKRTLSKFFLTPGFGDWREEHFEKITLEYKPATDTEPEQKADEYYVCKTCGGEFHSAIMLSHSEWTDDLTKPLQYIKEFGSADAVYLKEITIGKDVTDIGRMAFNNCAALERIIVDTENPNYCDVDGVLYTKDMKTLLLYPNQKTAASYTVPDGVETIAMAAFYQHPKDETYNAESAKNTELVLEEVILPDSVKTISEMAFFGNAKLASLPMGNGVEYIGKDAFSKCYGLPPAIYLPGNVKTIGDYCFYECGSLDVIAFANAESGIAFEGKYWRPKIDKKMFQTNYPEIQYGVTVEQFTALSAQYNTQEGANNG